MTTESDTRKLRVYKVELLVVDFDGLGEDGITDVIECTKYPNRCIHPQVKDIQSREVDWNDDHPLNDSKTCDEAFEKLFSTEVPISLDQGVQAHQSKSLLQVREMDSHTRTIDTPATTQIGPDAVREIRALFVEVPERRAPVQADMYPRHPDYMPGGSISWEEHLQAWRAYSARYGYGCQSAERIAERSGFSHFELVKLLGHEPTSFREHGK